MKLIIAAIRQSHESHEEFVSATCPAAYRCRSRAGGILNWATRSPCGAYAQFKSLSLRSLQRETFKQTFGSSIKHDLLEVRSNTTFWKFDQTRPFGSSIKHDLLEVRSNTTFWKFDQTRPFGSSIKHDLLEVRSNTTFWKFDQTRPFGSSIKHDLLEVRSNTTFWKFDKPAFRKSRQTGILRNFMKIEAAHSKGNGRLSKLPGRFVGQIGR